MARTYIDTSIAFAGLAPAQRIEQLRRVLAEERRAARDASASLWDAHVASKNVERLETALERAESNERLRAERIAELRTTEASKTAAHQDMEQAALEAELRRRYDQAMPKPVTDAEWAQVKDAVLHKHRLKQMDAFDQQVAETRRRYGSML